MFMVRALDNSCYGVLENLACVILVLWLISDWDVCGSGGLPHGIGSGYELQVGSTNLPILNLSLTIEASFTLEFVINWAKPSTFNTTQNSENQHQDQRFNLIISEPNHWRAEVENQRSIPWFSSSSPPSNFRKF